MVAETEFMYIACKSSWFAVLGKIVKHPCSHSIPVGSLRQTQTRDFMDKGFWVFDSTDVSPSRHKRSNPEPDTSFRILRQSRHQAVQRHSRH